MKKLLGLCLILIGMMGCVSSNPIDDNILWENPDPAPDWMSSNDVDDAEGLTIIGVSRGFLTEQEARSDALEDARMQIATISGEVVRKVYTEMISGESSTYYVDNQSQVETQIERVLSSYIGQSSSPAFYTRLMRGSRSQKYYSYAYIKIDSHEIVSMVKENME